jgi:hypothetical protein
MESFPETLVTSHIASQHCGCMRHSLVFILRFANLASILIVLQYWLKGNTLTYQSVFTFPFLRLVTVAILQENISQASQLF